MIKHCFLPIVTTLALSSILDARDHNIGQAGGHPSSHASSYSYATGANVTVQGTTGNVQVNAQGGHAVASSRAQNRGRRHHGHRSTPHMRIGHLHGGVHLGLQFHSHLHSPMGLSIVSHLRVGGHSQHFHHNQHHHH